MNIEMNRTIVFAILIAIIVFYLYTMQKRKQEHENWTLMSGGDQMWEEMPRDTSICDTGFDDDGCKFSAVNCLKNPNSIFYNNA